jgi:hypothetical protein
MNNGERTRSDLDLLSLAASEAVIFHDVSGSEITMQNQERAARDRYYFSC